MFSSIANATGLEFNFEEQVTQQGSKAWFFLTNHSRLFAAKRKTLHYKFNLSLVQLNHASIVMLERVRYLGTLLLKTGPLKSAKMVYTGLCEVIFLIISNQALNDQSLLRLSLERLYQGTNMASFI